MAVEIPKRITAGWLKTQVGASAEDRLAIGQVLAAKNWSAQELVDREVDPALFGFGNGQKPTPAGPVPAKPAAPKPETPTPDAKQPDADEVQDAINADITGEDNRGSAGDEPSICPGCGREQELGPEGFCSDCIQFA